ncbi:MULTISPECIES: hypothetical protein [Bacteroidota]|uniref:Uncharacterized protein n=1 Tax=Flectobacillus rivi TaxID=2984209 RepID=A0ABT6Z2F5_9BACT|nr:MULTISPECIES: hypothetical protein [Bacteroidota]MDI9875307.1 hypothetical protein [Flectobacillus rivi]NBB27361.1 hypothetical protein [Cellulophaga sp. BC115SP]
MLNRVLSPLKTWSSVWLCLFVISMSSMSVLSAVSSKLQQKPATSTKAKPSPSTKTTTSSKSATKSKKKKGNKSKRVAKVDTTDLDPTQVKVPLYQNP